jgi:hypothetical protein
MVNTGESNFVKIGKAEQKDSILNGILEDKKEILVKSTHNSGMVYVVHPISLLRDQLTCQADHSFATSEKLNKIIIQFTVGADKYLATAQCSASGRLLKIDLSGDIFQLHRREDFRLRIPISYKAHFQLKNKNAQAPMHLSLNILDLSAGGCRIQAPTHPLNLKIGDVLEGEVHLSKRDPIVITATVKHIVSDPQDENQIMAGIQFKDLGAIAKNRLQALVLDVYRELFSRL